MVWDVRQLEFLRRLERLRRLVLRWRLELLVRIGQLRLREVAKQQHVELQPWRVDGTVKV